MRYCSGCQAAAIKQKRSERKEAESTTETKFRVREKSSSFHLTPHHTRITTESIPTVRRCRRVMDHEWAAKERSVTMPRPINMTVAGTMTMPMSRRMPMRIRSSTAWGSPQRIPDGRRSLRCASEAYAADTNQATRADIPIETDAKRRSWRWRHTPRRDAPRSWAMSVQSIAPRAAEWSHADVSSAHGATSPDAPPRSCARRRCPSSCRWFRHELVVVRRECQGSRNACLSERAGRSPYR